MGFREVSVVEMREVLRAWQEVQGLRKVAERAGVDRKTARRYVEAAQAAGLDRGAGSDAVTDELIGLVVEAVRLARPGGHGAAWEALLEHEQQIRGCRWEDRGAAGPGGGAGSVPGGGPLSGSPTASRGWSASSTSPGWACCSTRRLNGDERSMR